MWHPKQRWMLFLFALFLLSTALAQEYPGFYVQGRFLYDPCGEKVILRGVANPNIWFKRDGMPYYEEIEKTGANVVRIVWETRGSAKELDMAISNCIAYSMIPMPECHDATGNWSKLQTVVDYWTRPDIVEVLKKHEAYLLLNIANEAGDYSISSTTFRQGYESAILKIRNAGIHVPLVIDASNWGQNINILQSAGPSLIQADPDHNLLFSVHMWWPKRYGYKEEDIGREIRESVAMGLPLIVGEFSQMHGSCDETTITPENSIPYRTIIRECHLNEIGYLAWSWFGNCNPLWDMTRDGTYETLYDWGLEVAVTDSFSIQNTSIRPYSILYGSCASPIEEKEGFPKGVLLFPAYPNPFNSETKIRYFLPQKAHVRLNLYDTLGHPVKTLVFQKQGPGEYTAIWDARDAKGEPVATGNYICRLFARDKSGVWIKSEKLLLIK